MYGGNDLDMYLISIQYSSLSYKEEIDLNTFLKMLLKNSYDCVICEYDPVSPIFKNLRITEMSKLVAVL